MKTKIKQFIKEFAIIKIEHADHHPIENRFASYLNIYVFGVKILTRKPLKFK